MRNRKALHRAAGCSSGVAESIASDTSAHCAVNSASRIQLKFN